jgi:hypothetical protein
MPASCFENVTIDKEIKEIKDRALHVTIVKQSKKEDKEQNALIKEIENMEE